MHNFFLVWRDPGVSLWGQISRLPGQPKQFFFFGLEGFWGQPQGPNFPSPWATMLASRLDCSTAALTNPQKVLPV